MKKMLILMLLTFHYLLSAQNDRFIYEVEYKKDSISGKTDKENYYLEITKENAVYYN